MYTEKRTAKDYEKELEGWYRHEIFEMMVNRASEIIILFSSDDNTANYVSPNVERLLGISVEELKENFARLAATAVNPYDIYTEKRLLEATAESGEGTLCARIHQKTGETRWFQEQVLRGRFHDSRKFLILLSDRTEEVVAAERLEQALSVARSANEGKRRFLADMSHDIRTPMNAIIGFSHLLEQERHSPEKVGAYARKISCAGKQMLGLINDVLDMSRLESGSADIQEMAFDVNDFLKELLSELEARCKTKMLTVQLRTVGLHETMLFADKTRLSQILLNILSNAVQFTSEDGTVSLTVTQTAHPSPRFSHLCFEIADTGVGISPEFIEHLFEPFSREKNTTICGVAGTGLGLAIVKALVDLLGGTIRVQSEKGVGTTFTVELDLQLAEERKEHGMVQSSVAEQVETPVAAAEACDGGADAQSAGNGMTVKTVLSGLHILAAEDNELNAEILHEVLQMEGASCDIAENGQIALEMFRASNPGFYDLILMDVQMPVMDGHQATREIRACDHPDAKIIPIAAMTANAFAEDVEAALLAGMDAHIAKPVDLDVLKAKVYWVLKKRAERA